MKLRIRRTISSVLAGLIVFAFIGVLPPRIFAATPSLKVTVQTDFPFYSPGELVRISGVVTNTTSAPIQGASVAVEVRDPNSNTLFLDITTSYANGSYFDSFRLSLLAPPGQYAVYNVASKIGYISGSNTTTFTVGSSAGIAFAVWTEQASYMRYETAVVHGKLLFNRTAVEGATITFNLIFPNRTLWLILANTTDSTGIANEEFYLSPTIPAGQYRINASSHKPGIINGTATGTSAILNKEPRIHQATVSPQVIEKPDAVNIQANVTDYEDGISLRVVSIITFPNGTVQIVNMSLIDSLFKIEYQVYYSYPSGMYSLTIRAIDKDAGSADYKTSFEVRTPILMGTACGWVLNTSAQPIPNAAVTLSLKTAYLTYQTTTNDQGIYSLTKIMPGQYSLITSAPEYTKETTEIQIIGNQTTHLNVSLYHLPVLKGTVTTQLGQPIANASVRVTGSQGLVGQGTTHTNGSYRLVLSSTGTFSATASAFEYSPNSTSITCSFDEVISLSFSLIKNGKLVGRVTDSISGSPVVNATLTLSKSQFLESQKTNSTGHFVYSSVSPGDYTLTATASGYLTNATTTSIFSNQTTSLQLTLTPTGNITGAVKEAAHSNPVLGATVSLIDYRGVTIGAVSTDSSGHYLFYRVKPANYSLKVFAYGYNTTSASVTVTAHTVSTVNFTLVPNVIYLALETMSNQYSRGETMGFTINAENIHGQSIADNVTAVTLVMRGPNNETRDLNCTREGDHFVSSYAISNNETMGTWTITTTVNDVFGNHAEAIKRISIREAFAILFYTDKSSYAIGENVNFTSYVQRYSNLSHFLNSTEVQATVDVRNAQNVTVATFNLTTSGNALTGQIDTTGLAKQVYTAYLTVSDSIGNIKTTSIAFTVVQDFQVTVNTDKSFYNRTEAVHIYGSVIFSNGTPATNTAVSITLVTRNYPRSFYAMTNSSGAFGFYFTPLGIDAGNYTIMSSSVVEGVQREATRNFAILGLALNPSYLTVSMSENSANDFSIKIMNLGETTLTGISASVEPSVIDGVEVSFVVYPQDTIAPGGWASFTIRVNAADEATVHTKFNLTARCSQGAVELGFVEVNLFPATPVLQVAPQLVDVSITPEAYLTHVIIVKNIGYMVLKNATIIPPSHSWITLSRASLGDIDPQETEPFDVTVRPPNSTPIGLYEDTVVIISQNHAPVSIYVIVKVTTAQNGTLTFLAIDDTNAPVSSARITIQYQEYWLQTETKLTNSTGFGVFQSLIGGRYSYIVAAENHERVSGTVTVLPASNVHVEVVLPLKVMEVSFNVIPMTFEDQNYIVLNMTFETDVPKPLLIPVPPVLQFGADRVRVNESGFDSTSYFSLRNTGLISVFNVSISVDTLLPNGYEISFGSFGQQMYLDEMQAKSIVQVPTRLVVQPGTVITELVFGIVGKIKVEGYFVYFDNSQNAQTARVNAEVLVRIIDKGVRRLCVNPPIIYGVYQDGIVSFVPGAWPKRIDDVRITNCAENESVYLPTLAVGGGVTLFAGFDLIQILTEPFDPTQLGGFVATGLITRYGGMPGEEITCLEAEETFGQLYVGLQGGPLWSLLFQAFVRQAQGQGTIGVMELAVGESAILSSDLWDIPTSFSELFESLLGFSVRIGVGITMGGILFAYRWKLDETYSLYLIPIFIIDVSAPYIAMPVPAINVTVPWSSGWGYSESSYIAPPSVSYPSQPIIPKIEPPPAETVHEVVKLSISQEATLERDAFSATLQMSNKMPLTRIEHVHAVLDIAFANGSTAADNFFWDVTDMQGISAIDGTGILEPGAKATANWLVIPKPGAGGTQPSGVYYRVLARITYMVGGAVFTLSSSNETINVKPQPLLVLDYYLPKEVRADEPFKLGIKVTNVGYGTARNFKIDSAQPVIYDNLAHLQITFSLIGSCVQGKQASSSLKIYFGDIKPGQSVMGYWIMICSLDGNFTEFSATFTHSNALGGEETSLIDAVQTHILVREIIVDEIKSAFLVDFDVDAVPDQVLDPFSGAVTEVVQMEHTVAGQNQTSLTVNTQKQAEKWILLEVNDPFNNQLEIRQIRRSDGKTLNEQNYWMGEGQIYIVDDPEEYYTIVFAIPPDVAVTHIQISKSVVGQGYSMAINVTVENQGYFTESFNVTGYANEAKIGTQFTTLASFSSKVASFLWNTSGFPKGNYTISFVAVPLVGENDTADNTLTDGWVIVAMIGDVTGPDGWPDGKVDIRDIAIVAKHFGETGPFPLPVANYDITGSTVGLADGKIDIRDIAVVAKNFGQTDP